MRGRTLAVRSVLALAAALLAGPVLAGPVLAGPVTAGDEGPWVWPLAGPHTVGRAFDPPATPYGPGHRGADLPGVPGQPVLAAGAGRISYAGLLAGRGVLVVVHGALRTTYEPVAAVVRVGEQVTAGQVIGRLAAGHPGCLPACLHWGLLRGDVYLDPVRLIRRGRSVLLPLDAAVAQAGVLPIAPDRPAAARSSASPVAAPRPASEPAFALRAGDAASAGGALVALVVGLVLVRRPPRPPHHPVTPAVAVRRSRVEAVPALVEPHAGGLVDLAGERHRRRPEVA